MRLRAACRQTKAAQEAVKELGVTWEEVDRLPPLTYALSQVPGGRSLVLDAMRLSTNPSVSAFLELYDASSKSVRQFAPWEAVAVAAKLDVTELFGAIVLALHQHHVSIIQSMLASNHPATVRATIENAMKPGGWRDRKAIHQMLGVLPVPKGQTIDNPIFSPSQESTKDKWVEPDEVDMDEVFPSLAKTQKLLSFDDN
jgi:hypothetical protein